jgi:integrase
MIHKVLSKRTGKTTWAISVRVGGNRYRQAGFKTKEKADDYIRDLKDAYRNRLVGIEPEYERRVITLQDLFEARARDPINMSTGSRRQLLRHFAEFVSIDPELPVRDMTVSRLASYRAALMGQFKVSTIEFVISGIVAGLNSGRLYFPELETFRAPALVGLPNPGRAVLIPRSELVAVRDELRRMDREAAADIFEALILTGCRVMELLKLRPEWIEWERGLVGLPGAMVKTKTPRVLPITPALEVLLRRRSKAPRLCYATFYRAVCAAGRAQGIEVGMHSWRIHDIRHTVASVLAESGINQKIIADLLGHSLGGMTSRYTHSTLPALRAASSVLESYWSGNRVAAFPRAVNE